MKICLLLTRIVLIFSLSAAVNSRSPLAQTFLGIDFSPGGPLYCQRVRDQLNCSTLMSSTFDQRIRNSYTENFFALDINRNGKFEYLQKLVFDKSFEMEYLDEGSKIVITSEDHKVKVFNKKRQLVNETYWTRIQDVEFENSVQCSYSNFRSTIAKIGDTTKNDNFFDKESCKSIDSVARSKVISDTFNEAFACLSREEMDRPHVRIIRAQLINLFADKMRLPKIYCGSVNGDSISRGRAAAYATLPPESPTIRVSDAVVEGIKKNSREARSVIFHELLHNCGHDHTFGSEFDRVYACERCCFPNPNNTPRHFNLACEICSAAKGSMSDLDLASFYRSISPFFESTFWTSKFLSSIRAEKLVEKMIEIGNPEAMGFAIGLQREALKRKMIPKGILFDLDPSIESEIERFRPLIDALLVAHDNPKAAADSLATNPKKSTNGVEQGVRIALIRHLLPKISRSSNAYYKLSSEIEGEYNYTFGK